MEKWLPTIATIVVLLQTSVKPEDGACSCGKSAVGGDQVTCQNVTPSFFQNVNLNLSRAHWFTCDNCILSAITEDTFNFSRNNVSYLMLNQTEMRFVGNFVFQKLPLLKVLNLRNNLIDTIEYKAFYGIKRLIQLDLSQNKMEILENGLFIDLQNLDILNLNDNEIFKIEPDAFIGLYNLKYLYFNRNKLLRLVDNTFKHLKNLKILYLENNGLEELHPFAFNNLRSLNYLYLNNNSISFLVQYSFKELTSLLELQMRFNNLSEIQTSAFNGLRNIKYLYLSHNNLSSIKPYGFIGLNSLLILDLMENKFENFSLEYLNGMEYLTSIWLQNNSIANFTVTKTSDTLNGIRIVDLLNNKLDLINFKFLHTKMPKLQQILIGNNMWRCGVIVQMYEYFKVENISLCLDYKCKLEETETYIQDLCKSLNPTEAPDILDTGQDFVLDSTNVARLDTSVIALLVIIFIFKDKLFSVKSY